MKHHHRLIVAGLLALAGTRLGAQSEDPWATLDTVRKSLATAGPEAARFVQTFVPAGFSTGESEQGQLALHLPDCLRWDYEQPYPKAFLVCGARVYSWNPEDRRGQRSWIEREKEPGLDLLLLPATSLAERYDAKLEARPGRRVAILLTPKGGHGGASLKEATLVVDLSAARLVELSYADLEGNRTRFEISAYHALGETTKFNPPEGIVWEDG